MRALDNKIEGSLYKTYVVGGQTFDIRYGYYTEHERELVEPLPIFPDLKRTPIYTEKGEPIVTSLQCPCEHYAPSDFKTCEEWCGDCGHYSGGKAEMGVCLCNERKLYR